MAKNFKAWPQSWPINLNYFDRPVQAFLDDTAKRVPNRTAIIFENMELKYGELKALSDRFAAALAGLGVRKGDRAAIHMSNCLEFAVAYYGLIKTGGIFTPLSPMLAPREALHQLNDSGAAPLALPVLEKMLAAFSGVVCEGYGMTECTMAAALNPPLPSAIRPGSVGVGLPLADTEMKVVDPDSGEDLSPGAEGEICIKGPQIMAGYWNKPEETANALRDGWLFTGDIGREDQDGYFYITARKKEMIIYKGYNVYPRELEEIIFEHPAVHQCAVVGKPDLAAGELPVAFVQVKPGTKLTGDEILNHTNSQIAPYKKKSGRSSLFKKCP